jgi:SAM-dependent methyltransferase
VKVSKGDLSYQMTTEKGWEAAYRKKPYVEVEPHAEVVKLVSFFKRKNVRKLLDLGCGDGRHLIYLARQGFWVFGLDNAPTAIRLASKWLEKENLTANLVCSDMSTIPWYDESFDAIISIYVINHHRLEGIRCTIREIFRVLKPGGWIFVIVGTSRPKPGKIRPKGEWVELEPNTYEWLAGHERGVPHHFFNKKELLELFSRFRIIDVHSEKKKRTCLLAQKPTH